MMTDSDQEDQLYIEPSHQPDDKKGKERPSALIIWLRIWATPLTGFKSLRKYRLPHSLMEAEVLYPTLALTAMGAFVRKFYFPDISISACLIMAISIFISFFITYFLIFPISHLLMRKDIAGKIDTSLGHNYVAALMATLAVFFFIYECLPFLEVLLAFTPAYTIYLSYKGLPVLNFPQSLRTTTWIILIFMMIALPLIIYEVLGMIMPVYINPS